MKIIKLTPIVPESNPTDLFIIVIRQMEGDADHYYDFELQTSNEDTLRDYIVCCEIVENLYSTDIYKSLNFWDNIFDGWGSDEYGNTHSFESYEVFYYNDQGLKHQVELEFDEAMKDWIKKGQSSAFPN